jgi:hypothetical protein
VVEHCREEELGERRVKKQEEGDEKQRAEASKAPAPESAGREADKMDVVVTENVAVSTTVEAHQAKDEEPSQREESLQVAAIQIRFPKLTNTICR